METISELMTPEPIRVRVDTTIPICARVMTRHHIRHLPVTDLDGRVAGMIEDGALFRLGGAAPEAPWMFVFTGGDDVAAAQTASDLMELPQLVLSEDAAIGPALRRLAKVRQGAALVVDADDHLVGIVTEHDGVRLAQSALPPMLRASHAFSHPVVTVLPDQPAADALKAMLDGRFRHVVVTDAGRVVGVVSLRDLVEDGITGGRHLAVRSVVRHSWVHTVTPSASLQEVAREMVRRRIGCVPVVDGANLVGVLTRADMVDSLAAALDEENAFGED